MNGLRALACTFATAAFVPAQQTMAELAAQLAAPDPVAVEIARRQLCLQPADALPRAALIELLQNEQAGAASAAASVLMHHGLAVAEVRGMLPRAAALTTDVLRWAEDGELVKLLASEDAMLRRRALWHLADRGALADDLLRAALEDEDEEVGRAAAAILIYERAVLPVAMLQDLSVDGKRRVIAGLSERPRAAAAPWLADLLRGKSLPTAMRMLAIAGLPPELIDIAHGREVFDAVTDPAAAREARHAAWRLPPKVVDKLVGHAHARIESGVDTDVMLACLENASDLGERQVLALSNVMSPGAIEAVCSWLAAREAGGLTDHIAAALDGQVPMEPHLLRRAGPLIDSPTRRERVVQILRSGQPTDQQLAFYALIEGKVFVPEMLDFAMAEDEGPPGPWSNRLSRVRMLLKVPLQEFPPDALLALLDDRDSQVEIAVCRALIRSPYPEAIEAELLGRAQRGGAQGVASGRAIAMFGSQRAVRRLWFAAGLAVRVAAVDWLLERPKPWVKPLFAEALAALEQAGVDENDYVQVDLRCQLLRGLAELGDPAAVDALVNEIGDLPLKLLWRCRSSVPAALQPRHLPQLRACLSGPDQCENDVREELTSWLAGRPDLDVAPILEPLWKGMEPEEIRVAALGGLLRGPNAAEYHEQLREAMQRPLSAEARELSYEVLGNASEPLTELEIDTIARMVWVAPLADPRAECAASLSGFPRSADYPMHLPIVDLLRRDTAVQAGAFERSAEAAAQHPDRYATSGRRLGHLMAEVSRFQHLRERIAPVLAEAILSTLDADPRLAGLADLILAEDAERHGRWTEAAERYERAARALRRQPLPPPVARTVLGDQSLADGLLPLAAMAARPWLCRARAHVLAGERDKARAVLWAARPLAEGDRPTEREFHELSEELKQ